MWASIVLPSPPLLQLHLFHNFFLMSVSRRYVFTLNNPTPEDVEFYNVQLQQPNVRYAVYGNELGASGTPHLQGFVIFTGTQRFNAVRQFLRRAHVESARGTSVQARDYCKKDGDFREFGEFPQESGRRTDLDALVAWSDEFTRDNGRPPSSPEIAKEHPYGYLKYPRFVRMCEHRCSRVIQLGTYNDWQTALSEKLLGDADPRKIDFMVDEDGGKGKTWFCRKFYSVNSSITQILSGGKRDDLAHYLDPTKKVFLFNIPRGGMEYLSYNLLEQLKDKLVFSGKYNSSMKVLTDVPHVVVFSNEKPDENKLSRDRFNYLTTFN